MVFHVTNYMRETNVWMIRKMRWILWGGVCYIPLYRNFYWDFHGRRVALKQWWAGKTENERRKEAEAQRADWGYHPRYTPVYSFSLKKAKYDAQTPEERYSDLPRLVTKNSREEREGIVLPKDVRTIVRIVSEHNRMPGAFDYNYPQTFYSLFPEIEQESYVTIGSNAKRRVHNEDQE
jgi:hypothetical protein